MKNIIINNLSMIVATDKKNGIGINNTLPWRLSDDLKRFKEITTGHTIIMGRKTWDSLPKKPLPNRRNVVLTRNCDNIANAEIANSIDDIFDICKTDTENFIIGGANIYEQTIHFCSKIYLTRVWGDYETDTFFLFLCEKEWKLLEKSEIKTDSKSGIQYEYLTFVREKF